MDTTQTIAGIFAGSTLLLIAFLVMQGESPEDYIYEEVSVLRNVSVILNSTCNDTITAYVPNFVTVNTSKSRLVEAVYFEETHEELINGELMNITASLPTISIPAYTKKYIESSREEVMDAKEIIVNSYPCTRIEEQTINETYYLKKNATTNKTIEISPIPIEEVISE